MFSHGHLGRVFTAIGLIVLTYGIYQWIGLPPLTEAEIEQRVEAGLEEELWQMEQVQVRRLAKAKEELGGMTPEEQALLLYQASEPIHLTPEQEERHRQAIRRDITEHHAYRKKRATSLMFLGGALLFMTLTPKLVERFMASKDGTPL